MLLDTTIFLYNSMMTFLLHYLSSYKKEVYEIFIDYSFIKTNGKVKQVKMLND